MTIFGCTLIVVGLALYSLGIAPMSQLPYVGWYGPAGVALIVIGLAVSLVGIIVRAIRRASQLQVDALTQGFERLSQQVRQLRMAIPGDPVQSLAMAEPAASVAGAFQPSSGSIGYCPGCRRVRGMIVPKCTYCGDERPTHAQ